MSSWQSYKCFDLNYRMMVIESLDSDSETRRLSPVAVLGDSFVDLINGSSTVVWLVDPYDLVSVLNSVVFLWLQALRITVGVMATPARRGCLCSTASWPPVTPTASTSPASVRRTFA